MAEDAASEGEIVAATVGPQRFDRKMQVLAGACLLLLVVGGGTAAYLLSGASGKAGPVAAAAHGEGEAQAGETYVEVPAMIVNLRSPDGAPRLIKVRLMLVPGHADGGAAITTRLPVIIDGFQPFLRELRPEDLAGSAAVFRIKEELLIRANAATAPGTVRDVLIQDLIQQ